MLHYYLNPSEKRGQEFFWESPPIPQSQEAIISWNGSRPQKGNYAISLQLFINGEWTERIPYANWGQNSQHMYASSTAAYTLDQDVLTAPCFDAIRILIKGEDLSGLRSLHLFHRTLKTIPFKSEMPDEGIELHVAPLSQLDLNSKESHRICSPTSTTSVIRYHSPSRALCPLEFAKNVYDSAFSIYGNWVLNVAQASAELGANFQCYVTRLKDLSSLYWYLSRGTPVITSIKGPISGGASPYQDGHLVVVTGFDVQRKEVLCMDPAFTKESPSPVRYPLEDFTTAWKRRDFLAYVVVSL